ncbi:MAG: hypothetical protein ACJ8LI_08590 [Chthoniobacterales bacterium]
MRPQLELLVETIRHGISRRGFYILMDDRLALIAGGKATQLAALKAFAARYAWSAELLNGAVVFSPSRSEQVSR